MGFQEYKISKVIRKEDFLHINHSKKKITASLTRFVFRDKDTNLYVSIIPSLSLTGYGATKKKAYEMLKFSLDDYNVFLVNLSSNKMADELKRLGWIKNKIKNKDYSRAYIDINGELKEFNVIEETIESDQLTFA